MNVAVRKAAPAVEPDREPPYLSPVTQAADGFPRRAFTIDDVRKMVEAGVIDEDEKWELVDGDIVPMQAKSHAHERIKSALNIAIARALPDDLWSGVESSMYLATRTMLEPDIVVYRRKLILEDIRGPDILLAIEVAQTSLRKDRGLKARLYAEFGVQEFWVVDANARKTYRHRVARDGEWTETDILPGSAELTFRLLPGFAVRLEEVD